MTRLNTTFATLKSANRAALIPFIMAGDPNLAASARLLHALPDAGADIIELGIPFSDPMADGPVIQAAGIRALQAGTTLKKILAMVQDFRRTNTKTPIVLMGYYNPFYRYGVEAFTRDAAAAGVDGVIAVDLPPEEETEFATPARAAGLDLIRLISPVTDGQRVGRITRAASGFVYYVSLTGVTGAASAPLDKTELALQRIRQQTSLPVGVGFGIKTPADAAAMARIADAVIVGSSLVTRLHETGDVAQAAAFVRELADAVHTAREKVPA